MKLKNNVEGRGWDTVDQEGRTALFYAVKDGNEEICAELIKNGTNVNAQDKNLEAPLHFAARNYQLESASLLIKNGACVEIKDVHGNTPLYASCFRIVRTRGGD